MRVWMRVWMREEAMHAWRGFLFLLSTLIWVHLAFISKLFSATVINDDDNVPKLTVLEPTELKLNRQTVQVPQGIRAFDISNGTLLHLKCLGSQPLSWSFPTNHMHENDSIANLAQVTQSCKYLPKTRNKKEIFQESYLMNHSNNSEENNSITSTTDDYKEMICESYMMLNDTVAEHTGFYSCHYNASVPFSPVAPNSSPSLAKEVQNAVYVFVNEVGYLLVPPDGNTYIFMSVVSSYPALIPCKATASHVQTSLRKAVTATGESESVKVGREYGIYFDATQGFYFESIQYDHGLSYLECHAQLNQDEEVLQVNLHFSIDPGNLHPIINGEEATFVNVNSSFALTCSVRSEVGVVIAGMTFVTPVNDSSRIVMEDSRSIRGTDKSGAQDQYVITSRRLIVKNANYSDEGNYTCIVKAQTGKQFSVEHFVKVYDSSEPFSVNLTTDFYTDYETALRRKPGQDVQFVVHVTAFPNISSFSLTWLKDNAKLMHVKPVFIASLYGQQSLLVTSPLLTSRSSSLLLHEPYLQDVVETASSPFGHISALIEGKQAILRISSVNMKDSGVYTLMANNTSDESVSASVSMILRVDGAPVIEIDNDKSAKEYFLSESKYILSCTAFGPEVKELYWRWLSCSSPDQCYQDLHTGSSKWIDILDTSDNDPKVVVLSQVNDTLSRSVNSSTFVPTNNSFNQTIKLSVTAKTSGYYSCSAVNDMGSTRQDSLFVVTAAQDGLQMFTSTDEPIEFNSMNITCIGSRYRFSSNDSSILRWSFTPAFKNETSTSLIQLNVSSETFSLSNSNTKSQQIPWKVVNSLSGLDLRSDIILSPANSSVHSGSYTCTAITGSNDSRTSSVRSDIFIQKPEGAVVTFSNMNSSKIERTATSSLEFVCEVSGRPKPTLVWFKNSQKLDINQTGVEVSLSGDKLSITRLASSDSGKYECVAENSVSKASRFVMLKVLDKSKKQKPMKTWYGILTPIIMVVGGVLIIMAFIVGRKVREDRRQKDQMKFIADNLLYHDQMGMFNPNIPLDEQAAMLPYDPRWEFPRKRLKFGKILGQGAFGRVVQAEAVGLNEGESSTTVAVKMLKERCDESQRQALIAELKILIHLGRHVNIVNLLAAVTTGLARGELLVVVEYCKYGNLREFLLKNRSKFIDQIDPETGRVDNSITTVADTMKLRREDSTTNTCSDYENINSSSTSHSYTNSISINHDYENFSVRYTNLEISKSKEESIKTCDLICYCFQVSRGMEYLASKKLIHRDLAARNVLLAEEGVVKICDFGLAKDCFKYDEYVKQGNGPLPIKWMAIESIGDKVYTTKSDVWSFGVLCWELFSLGADPYPGQDINQEFYKNLKKGNRMEKPNYCPGYFYSDIMTRCWSEDPETRPEFKELTDVIGNILESSVRLHYVDLNDPYQQMNEVLFANNDGYLSMMPIDEQIEQKACSNDILVDLSQKTNGDSSFKYERPLNFPDLLSVDDISCRMRNCSLQDDLFKSSLRGKVVRSASTDSSFIDKNFPLQRPSNFDIIQKLSNSCKEVDSDAFIKKRLKEATDFTLKTLKQSYRRRTESTEPLDVNSNSNTGSADMFRDSNTGSAEMFRDSNAGSAEMFRDSNAGSAEMFRDHEAQVSDIAINAPPSSYAIVL